MGYSHKWYRPVILPIAKWRAFVADWTRVQGELFLRNLALAGPDGEGAPILDDRLVAFNGAGEARYEEFLLARRFERPERVKEDGRCFSFCKTQFRPYDLAVTACLLVAKRHFGDDLSVHSDGEDKDWQATRDLCEGVLSYGRSFHVDADKQYQLIERRS